MRTKRRLRSALGRIAVISTLVPALACACAVQQKKPAVAFVDNPQRPSFPKVLVVSPPGPEQKTVWRSFREEIEGEFDVVTQILDDGISAEVLGARIESTSPACVLLLDNRSAALYRTARRGLTNPPPAMILMTSFARMYNAAIPNSTGITYEIPAVSIFLRLRSLTGRPMDRVGVFQRPPLAGFLARQRALAKKEGIELIAIETTAEPSAAEIALHVENLKRQGVRNIWLLNDNRLLTPELIVGGWIPALSNRGFVVVVGVESLVSQVPLGTFAMLPNHRDLGVQAADMVFRLADADWDTAAAPMEEPHSVESVVQLEAAMETLGLDEDGVASIDRVHSGAPR